MICVIVCKNMDPLMRSVVSVCPRAAEAVNMSLDEDARWLDWVTKQFESIAGDDKEIDIDEFKTALKVKEVRKSECDPLLHTYISEEILHYKYK